MRLGILCAGDEELAPFLPLIRECTVQEKGKLKFYSGKILQTEVVALYSGVCKVNAAIAALLLIEEFGAEAVINAGTAGGMRPGLQVLDTVISTEAVYHDVAPEILTDFHPWMQTECFPADERLLTLSRQAVRQQKPEHAVYWGRMATGEAFIDAEGRERIRQAYEPLCVDMETAAIAHVCYALGIPFLAIRSITDTEEQSGIGNFEQNCRAASAIAKDITVALIGQLEQSALGEESRRQEA